MYNASGTASTMQIAVTRRATPSVRSVVTRNTVSVNACTMLWVVNLCTTAPVKLLVLQNAETRSTASDPR